MHKMIQWTKMVCMALALCGFGAVVGCQKTDKEIDVKMGKAIRYWVHDFRGTEFVKETQLSVVFERAFVCKTRPWDWQQRQYDGRQYLIVYARVQNMGPREIHFPFVSSPEVRVRDGSIHGSELLLLDSMGPRAPSTRAERQEWKHRDLGSPPLKQGGSTWWAFHSMIPDDATPTTLSGMLEDHPGSLTVKFRLELPRDLAPSPFD